MSLRWERRGDGPDPAYFVSTGDESLRLESNAASHVARFITNAITCDANGGLDQSSDADLNKYSLEILAGSLEDNGYTVSSPG